MAACNSPANASIDAGLVRPEMPYEFSTTRDQDIATDLSSGLSACSRMLFFKLLETIRSGQAAIITDEWMRSSAAAFSPVYYPPVRRGPRCEDYDNGRCPCEDGTPGCEGGKPL